MGHESHGADCPHGSSCLDSDEPSSRAERAAPSTASGWGWKSRATCPSGPCGPLPPSSSPRSGEAGEQKGDCALDLESGQSHKVQRVCHSRPGRSGTAQESVIASPGSWDNKASRANLEREAFAKQLFWQLLFDLGGGEEGIVSHKEELKSVSLVTAHNVTSTRQNWGLPSLPSPRGWGHQPVGQERGSLLWPQQGSKEASRAV